MGKFCTRFQTKKARKTIPFVGAHTYKAYIRGYPPPRGGLTVWMRVSTVWTKISLLFYSPSTVILVVASGLSYANFFIDDTAVLVALLSLITVGYGVICLYTSQEFQLKVAKLLSVVFALLMAYVAVGVAAQIGDDLYERAHPTTSTPAPTTHPWSPNVISKSSAPTPLTKNASLALGERLPAAVSTSKSSAPTTLTTAASLTLGESLPAAVSTMYLAGLAGIFVLAGLLHLTEAYCLIHGIWYLFFLPSGYLLLIIYSICNITDRSWGKYVGCYYYYFNLYSFFNLFLFIYSCCFLSCAVSYI